MSSANSFTWGYLLTPIGDVMSRYSPTLQTVSIDESIFFTNMYTREPISFGHLVCGSVSRDSARSIAIGVESQKSSICRLEELNEPKILFNSFFR